VTLSGSSPLPASKDRLMGAARANLGGVKWSTGRPVAGRRRFRQCRALLLDRSEAEGQQDHLSDTKVSLSAWRANSAAGNTSPRHEKSARGFSVAANEIRRRPSSRPTRIRRSDADTTGNAPDSNARRAGGGGRHKFFKEKVVDNLKGDRRPCRLPTR
jgi:OOP family OmpA-OmpF porin